MNNKEKVISILQDIKHSAETADPDFSMGIPQECDLCKIYIPRETLFGQFFHIKVKNTKACIGCPFSTTKGTAGCMEMNGTADFDGLEMMEDENETSLAEIIDAVDATVKVLEKIPVKRFTKSGWSYFSKLDHLKTKGK